VREGDGEGNGEILSRDQRSCTVLIEINLAPGAQVRRGPRRRPTGFTLPSVSLPSLGGDPRVVGGGALAALLLGLVAWLFWSQGTQRAELEGRIASEVADSTRFATTIALVNSLQSRQDTIRQQIAVIRDVDQRRYVWPHLMEEISQALPPFTWLTQITSTPVARPAVAAGDTVAPPPPAGPAFSLQGMAGSTQALTRFMKNLEASYFMRDVTLVTSEQVEVEGRMLQRFSLEARYEDPPASAIRTIPVVVVE
jgi:Tfp pilus assembly protein PilN